MEVPKFEDKTFDCKICQKEFKWSARDQQYYAKKGFKKQPQKCSSCREKSNKLRDESMFYVHCGICDKDGVSLSPPPKDRVAICEQCYNKLVNDSLGLKQESAPSS